MAFSEPAFPFNYEGDGGQQVTHQGMSLRDWFAGQALPGGMVHDTLPEHDLRALFGPHRTGIKRAEIVAADAYRIADAMLARSPQVTESEILK